MTSKIVSNPKGKVSSSYWVETLSLIHIFSVMKKHAWFSLFLFLLLPLLSFSQDIQILDVLSGRFMGVNKMSIGPDNSRYYSLASVRDSFELNEQSIRIDTSQFPHTVYPYLLGVNEDKSFKFVKEPGGEFFLLKDTTFLVFVNFSNDTLFATDTFFIQEKFDTGKEIVALEYNFDGDLIKSKHWTSPYRTEILLTAVVEDGDALYLTGAFHLDTLLFDNVALPCHDCGLKADGFVARFDDLLNCEWIKLFGGGNDDSTGPLTIGANHTILTSGAFHSSRFYACEDSLSNPFGWSTNDLFLAELTSSGDCNFIKEIDGSGFDIGIEVNYLSDGSLLVGGVTNSQEIDFKDSVLQNVATGFNGIIGKYSTEGEFIKAVQLYGANNQKIAGMVVDDNDNIWICGSFESDTLTFGTSQLFLHTPGKADVFIAKYNKNLNPLFATSLKGNGSNFVRELQKGVDGKIYCLLTNGSDTLFLNNEIFRIKTQRAENLSIEIKDVQTSLTSVPPYAVDINIYPNPLGSNDVLHFDLPDEGTRHLQNINLYSLYGQRLSAYSQASIKDKQIQLPRLSTGLYYVVFDFGEKQEVRKIVVQ